MTDRQDDVKPETGADPQGFIESLAERTGGIAAAAAFALGYHSSSAVVARPPGITIRTPPPSAATIR